MKEGSNGLWTLYFDCKWSPEKCSTTLPLTEDELADMYRSQSTLEPRPEKVVENGFGQKRIIAARNSPLFMRWKVIGGVEIENENTSTPCFCFCSD